MLFLFKSPVIFPFISFTTLIKPAEEKCWYIFSFVFAVSCINFVLLKLSEIEYLMFWTFVGKSARSAWLSDFNTLSQTWESNSFCRWQTNFVWHKQTMKRTDFHFSGDFFPLAAFSWRFLTRNEIFTKILFPFFRLLAVKNVCSLTSFYCDMFNSLIEFRKYL